MDFIDDFINEYKNNPCLWKADSVHFKNRSKRQDAYVKLINVAAKHGEHYNVERTKQKINNLRCAFRHQLKKYIELKNNGENDEIYCPKRRYFESLMFLKDEESSDKKSKGLFQQNAIDIKINAEQDSVLDFVEPIVYSKNQTMDISPTGSLAGDCGKVLNECAKSISAAFDSNKTTLFVGKEIAIPSDDEKSTQISNESLELSQTHDTSKESSDPLKTRISTRKRSSSSSSQLSHEADLLGSKILKTDFTMDLEKIVSLACRSIQSNIDDHFSNVGKIIAHKLRTMEPSQAIYAEKIIADVVFQGQMKLLSALSINQFLNVEIGQSLAEIYPNKH